MYVAFSPSSSSRFVSKSNFPSICDRKKRRFSGAKLTDKLSFNIPFIFIFIFYFNFSRRRELGLMNSPPGLDLATAAAVAGELKYTAAADCYSTKFTADSYRGKFYLYTVDSAYRGHNNR